MACKSRIYKSRMYRAAQMMTTTVRTEVLAKAGFEKGDYNKCRGAKDLT